MAGTTGLGTAPGIANTQVTDSTRRQNRQNSHNRSTEVHGGYTEKFPARLRAVFTHLFDNIFRRAKMLSRIVC
jgi:hypothetical protein